MLLSGMGYVLTSSGKLGSKNVISAETMSSGTGKRTSTSQSEANEKYRSVGSGAELGSSAGASVGAGRGRSRPARVQRPASWRALSAARETAAAALRPRAAHTSSDGCAEAHKAVRIRAMSGMSPARRGSAGAFPSCIHKYRRRWHFTSRKDIHTSLFYHSSAPRATEKALPLC